MTAAEAADAQRLATLAVAAEQRTSNLIALYIHDERFGFRSAPFLRDEIDARLDAERVTA